MSLLLQLPRRFVRTVLSNGLVCLLLTCAPASARAAEDLAKAEKVGDTPRVFDIPNHGTIEVYESLNTDDRHYIAPKLRFIPFDPRASAPEIARKSTIPAGGSRNIFMKLEIVTPDIRSQVAAHLAATLGKVITLGNVGNLKIQTLIVDLQDQALKEEFLLRPFVLKTPAPTQTVDVSLAVRDDKAGTLVDGINKGSVGFTITYSFNQIDLDFKQDTGQGPSLV